jgi:hypothetical protein
MTSSPALSTPLQPQLLLIRHRPVRLLYVVNSQVSQTKLAHLWAFNQALWGSQENLFVPCDGERIKANWWQVVIRHDADMIMWVGEILPALKAQLFNTLQPFSTIVFTDNIPPHAVSTSITHAQPTHFQLQQGWRNGDTLIVQAPPIAIAQGYWITELDLSSQANAKQGYTPSRFVGLTALLSQHTHPYNTRVSNGFLTRLTTQQGLLTFHLPNKEALFIPALTACGWQVATGGKRRYYYGILKLVGGLSEMDLFTNDIGRKMFASGRFRNNKAYTPHEMKSELKLGGERFLINQFIRHLASRQILLRGYELVCPHCNTEAWYDLQLVQEMMTCSACLSEFQLDVDVLHAFKLNELFSQGLKQGATTILLTLRFLQNCTQKGMLWDVDYEVTDAQGKTDIDFLAMCDGYLVMGECKDALSQELPYEQFDMDRIIEQLRDSLRVAERAKANLFIFSTFAEVIPQVILDFITDYQSTTTLPIRTLTRQALLEGMLADTQTLAELIGE